MQPKQKQPCSSASGLTLCTSSTHFYCSGSSEKHGSTNSTQTCTTQIERKHGSARHQLLVRCVHTFPFSWVAETDQNQAESQPVHHHGAMDHHPQSLTQRRARSPCVPPVRSSPPLIRQGPPLGRFVTSREPRRGGRRPYDHLLRPACGSTTATWPGHARREQVTPRR